MSEQNKEERIKKLQGKIEELEAELVCEHELVERAYLRSRIRALRKKIKEIEEEGS